jgi:hypothetical protein
MGRDFISASVLPQGLSIYAVQYPLFANCAKNGAPTAGVVDPTSKAGPPAQTRLRLRFVVGYVWKSHPTIFTRSAPFLRALFS